MWMKHRIGLGGSVFMLGAAAFVASAPASASDAGAFIGGVFATKLLGNMERRTQAEEHQAAVAQPRYVTAPPASKSPEARIKELDSLAAGGYITPEEYKAKKQQILNSM